MVSKTLVGVMLVVIMALLVALCTLPGCNGLYSKLSSWQAENPTSQAVAVDEDADGLPDVYVQADADGKPILDAAGKPVEVPGTRREIGAAKDTDVSLSLLLGSIAVLVPGAAGIASYAGRLKPIQRLQQLQTHFSGLVKNIQAIRTTGKLPPDSLTAFNALLADLNKQVAGLNDAIDAAKDDLYMAGELPTAPKTVATGVPVVSAN
jgi:hypothetical protein